jgi:hypothetical protein
MTANESKQAGAVRTAAIQLAPHLQEGRLRSRGWEDEQPQKYVRLDAARDALAAAIAERDAARASDEHTAKVLRAMERDYRQQLDTAREALREAQRDAAIARDLIDLCGYVEDGSHTTVSIFQDDASSQWALYVGKRPYYGNSLREAIDEALARPSPASASAATCATWGAINAALNSTGQLAPLASVAAQTSEDEADAHLSKALELLREALPCVFAVHMEEVGTRLCKPGTLTARIEEYLKSVEGK